MRIITLLVVASCFLSFCLCSSSLGRKTRFRTTCSGPEWHTCKVCDLSHKDSRVLLSHIQDQHPDETIAHFDRMHVLILPASNPVSLFTEEENGALQQCANCHFYFPARGIGLHNSFYHSDLLKDALMYRRRLFLATQRHRSSDATPSSSQAQAPPLHRPGKRPRLETFSDPKIAANEPRITITNSQSSERPPNGSAQSSSPPSSKPSSSSDSPFPEGFDFDTFDFAGYFNLRK